MRFCITALTCFLCLKCWAQETKGPSLVGFISWSGDTSIGQLFIANDELFVSNGYSKTSKPDAKTLESIIFEFELRDTPNGQLIILGGRRATHPQFAGKTFNTDKGYCVTADYSSIPPSIKLTKEPEKYSYWKVPKDEGPIVNVSDFTKRAYLSLDSEMTTFNDPRFPPQALSNTLEVRRVTLSLSPTYQFQVQKVEQPIAK